MAAPVSALWAGSDRHSRLAGALGAALGNHELDVAFQPVIDLPSGHISGMEALLRWNHPDEGRVPPAEFIPLAEQLGLISAMGEWVLQVATTQAARWQAIHSELGVQVNVSPAQLDDGFYDSVGSALARSGLDATRLTLEVTEQVAMTDLEHKAGVLDRVRALGVRVAIDDFGMGYSSLAYLKELPADEVKVDLTFIQRLGNSEVDAAIVKAIVDLAHTVGMDAVAEGVETPEHAAAVRSLEFERAQGYFWGRPSPAAEIDLLLATS